MNHPLRCRCGTVRGHVVLPATTSRGVCYCRDCQGYARFLGPDADVLDDAGGTDLLALPAHHLRLEEGSASLASVRMTSKGPVRWYAACCRTPIGNTMATRKVAYVGLLHDCLSSQPLEPAFGPVTLHFNTASATRPVPATPLAMVWGMAKIASFVAVARVGGKYRDNPFFDASGALRIVPRVLTPQERSALLPVSG